MVKAIVVKPRFFVRSVGVKGVQVEEIYDLQSKCQRYVMSNLYGEQQITMGRLDTHSH